MAKVTDFLVSELLKSLFHMGKEELARQLGLSEDVKKLQVTLQELQCYLQDADQEKSIEDASTNQYLDQIQDVVYDIEDVLDDYNALKDDISESRFSSVSSVMKTKSKHRIGVEIENLNKKLEEKIKNRMPGLPVKSSAVPREPVAEKITPAQPRAHMMGIDLIRSDIVGNIIHDDARRLIESLTKEDDRDNLLVYAIVGMGGIGKTTLAKLVFRDHVIEDSFEVKLSIDVSQNCDEIDIMRRIITLASGVEESSQNFTLLYHKVKKIVEGKRLFMVLDDVWETERIWKGVLRSLLMSGAAEGSRLLITTRNKEIADQMMAVHSHQVQPLSLEDGWSLLCKSAFPAWEQHEANDLKEIGMKLVKKCDGLPLAIQVIGGLLSAEKRTREAWEFVLKSSGWEVKGLPEEIHSALYLSYQLLPTNIKQCFLYFSAFPRFQTYTGNLVENLWIHAGFIKDETGISSHDTAKCFLWALVQRNLLKIDYSYSFLQDCFTIHDLVYSLSRFLKQNESLVVTDAEENLNCSGSTTKLRHLSFSDNTDKRREILPNDLKEQVSLRSLSIFHKSIRQIDHDLFNHLRHLRILMLRGTEVKKLPKSLGALKQLRYLNLSWTHIEKLPKTIQKLTNLRSLDVSFCVNLRKLPSCIMNLHRLDSLYVYRSGLEHLPPGLGKLNKVQILDFIMPLRVIPQESSTLKDLGTLTELRRLGLHNLERVLDKSQAESAALKEKQHLKSLFMSWSKRDSTTDSVQVNEFNKIMEEIIFEELCPPPHLSRLLIENYSGSKLPTWLGHAKLKSLMSLLISSCSNCKKLDGLGSLASLESLAIEYSPSIESIGSEFYTGSAHQNDVFLPRIKKLVVGNMAGLEKWSGLGEDKPVMPRLENLKIHRCPKLKSFPEELLQHAARSLKEIRIGNSSELLLKVLQNLPCLKILEIENIPHMERISGLPELQELQIKDCPGIKLVELTHHLQTIFWKDSNTETLPVWVSNDDNKLKATHLKISCKKGLVTKISSDYEWFKIQHFDGITIWEDGHLRFTYTKNTNSFKIYPDKTEGTSSSVE